ncbi:MAG TPA: hypothetical protein DHW63_08130, partial [Hyphomonadaceae bacterium]|nr:hypothetical protein [Hyphomonadaceae bacterium]
AQRGSRAAKRRGALALGAREHDGTGFVVSRLFPLVSRVLRPLVGCPFCSLVAVSMVGVALGESRVWVMDMSAIREGMGPLMSRKEAARYLTERGFQMAPQTLARKFSEGTGPLCTGLNRRAMYYKVHLDEWFREQLATPRRSSSAPRVPASTLRPATASKF